MTNLEAILERLGLSQYLDSFLDEGFDTWETVLDITESDFDALNVKLGHRRRLQREIVNARSSRAEQHYVSSTYASSVEVIQSTEVGGTHGHSEDVQPQTIASNKRRYRRHPKPDENAPGRSPSAYVLFSNHIREELRHLKLSFTEIARTVGERWQQLTVEEKEPYESRAAASKAAYNAEMARYKKTSDYKLHSDYLADFKAKNSSSTGKRPKLERQAVNSLGSSAGSISSLSAASPQGSPVSGLPSFAAGFIDSTGAQVPPPQVLTSYARGPSVSQSVLEGHQKAIKPSMPHEQISNMGQPEAIDRPPLHGSLSTLPVDSVPARHPRRSNNPTASFLRRDTSKSSSSSYGAASSPFTSIEEQRFQPAPPSGGFGTGSDVESSAPAYATPSWQIPRNATSIQLAPAYDTAITLARSGYRSSSPTLDGLSLRPDCKVAATPASVDLLHLHSGSMRQGLQGSIPPRLAVRAPATITGRVDAQVPSRVVTRSMERPESRLDLLAWAGQLLDSEDGRTKPP